MTGCTITNLSAMLWVQCINHYEIESRAFSCLQNVGGIQYSRAVSVFVHLAIMNTLEYK